MVNLRRYLNGSEESQRRAVEVLIHGIAESSVCLSPADEKAFSETIAHLSESAPPGCDGDELLIMSALVIQALQDHNSRASDQIRRQAAEFHNMIAMLGQSVITISGGASSPAAEQLRELRRTLESAALLADVSAAKVHLGEALRLVCEEVGRRKADLDSALSDLQRQAERGTRFVVDEDVATGLARRKTAEDSIRQAVIIPGRKYLVTVVFDRLQSLNARFGQEFGDRVLKALAEHMKEHFDDSDVLFRWSGPAVIALIWREESIEQVRTSIRLFFDAPFEKEFDVDGRRVTIPIAAAWSVIGLIPPAINSFNHVDRFVASQSPKDYC